MVAQGHVHNGVVILAEGVRLPEGLQVTVLPLGTALPTPPSPGWPRHSLLDIPTVRLGPVLHNETTDDDLLGEMLEGRP